MSVQALITTSDALTQLNLPSDYSDDELQTYIDASTQVVERHRGSIVSRDRSDIFDGGGNSTLALRYPPVLVIAQVVEDGVVLGTDDVVLNPLTGMLFRVNGVFSGLSPQNVTVNYTAGCTDVEADWKLAALIILQDLWATRRGSSGPVFGGGSAPADDAALVRANYRLPRRAIELLGLALPGIA